MSGRTGERASGRAGERASGRAGEQASGRAGAWTGVLVREDRTLIRMFGRDPLKMIQGLATNDIAGADVDATVYTTFLNPKGKMVGDARVVRRANGDVWIEADRAAADNIVAHLRKFVPPLFARFETLAGYAVLGLYGPRASEIAATLAPEVVLANAFRADALDLVVDAERAEETENAAVERGATPIGVEQFEVLRIEAGEPKWGAELTEEVIPLEAGLREAAISERKGCYTGQEVIVRILHRGHVNRHLRGILMGSREVPESGAELVRAEDGKVAGKITSACASPMMEQTIALAYVRREIEPPATLMLNGSPVDVVALPFAAAAHGAEV